MDTLALLSQGRIDPETHQGTAVPGSRLRDAIEGAAKRGRPCWRLGDGPGGREVIVPRLWLQLDERGGLVFPTHIRTPETVLRAPLVLAFDSQHRLAFELLGPHDLAQWRRLWAAALRDLHGLALAEIADEIAARGKACDESEAGKQVRAGRALWRRLDDSWPWRYLDGDGRPPGDWMRAGGGPALDALFEVWATGRVSLGQLAAAWAA